MVWFLNYEKGRLIPRRGKLIETYTDSFSQVWAEIAYKGSRLNLTIETVKGEKQAAA